MIQPLVFMHLYNPFSLSVGMTCDFFPTTGIWQTLKKITAIIISYLIRVHFTSGFRLKAFSFVGFEEISYYGVRGYIQRSKHMEKGLQETSKGSQKALDNSQEKVRISTHYKGNSANSLNKLIERAIPSQASTRGPSPDQHSDLTLQRNRYFQTPDPQTL